MCCVPDHQKFSCIRANGSHVAVRRSSGPYNKPSSAKAGRTTLGVFSKSRRTINRPECSDSLSRRTAMFASEAILQPKRCTGSHARSPTRALKTDRHPSDNGPSHLSIGSIPRENTNETRNPLQGTRNRDQLCSCFHPSAHNDAGRGDECRAGAEGFSPGEATTDTTTGTFNTPYTTCYGVHKK